MRGSLVLSFHPLGSNSPPHTGQSPCSHCANMLCSWRSTTTTQLRLPWPLRPHVHPVVAEHLRTIRIYSTLDIDDPVSCWHFFLTAFWALRAIVECKAAVSWWFQTPLFSDIVIQMLNKPIDDQFVVDLERVGPRWCTVIRLLAVFIATFSVKPALNSNTKDSSVFFSRSIYHIFDMNLECFSVSATTSTNPLMRRNFIHALITLWPYCSRLTLTQYAAASRHSLFHRKLFPWGKQQCRKSCDA